MFKKFTATISMLALALAALVFMPATAANAAITLDMTGQTIKFSQTAQTVNTYSSGQSGGFTNDITVYRNAATVSGVVMDAVITVDKSLAPTYTLDAASSAVSAPPAGNTSPTAAELLQTDVTPSAANNYITLKFQFYEGGTYTGYGTGNLLTLTNLSVNSYDLDYVSGHQFTQFKGFQTYKYSSNTTLVTSSKTGGWVQFTDNTTTNYSDTTGSYTKGRVMVTYDQLTELSVRHGVDTTNGGKFALDFGPGYSWKDTAVQTTNSFNNPNNSPPTSANKTIYYSVSAPWVFNLGNFTYADPENNAFTTLKIVTLPASGTLQQLIGSTWTNLTAGDAVSVATLTNGGLRYNGTVDSSFTFKVNDGTSDSTSAYTMTLTAATNAQTITFANPGTKQVSATAFASNATASSSLTVTLTSLSTGTCSVSGLNITALANGFCTILATQAGNASYGEAPAVTQTFPISNLTAQTITFASIATQTVSTTQTIAPTASSGLAVTVISQTTSVCTISGFTVTHAATGTCILHATQAGNGTYSPAAPVDVTFLVNTGSKTAQTINFAQPANQALATGSITVSATASSSLAITFASSTTSVCTVSSTTVTFVTSGYCTISASQAGNGTYASATLSRSFYIQEITTSSLASGTVGTSYSQSLASFGGSTATNAWSNSGTLPAGLSLDASTGVISGTPTASQSATSYTFTVVNGGVTSTRSLSITIAAAPVTTLTANVITFNALADVLISAATVTLGATASSGLTVTYTSNTTSVCTVSGSTVTLLTGGYCEVEADQAGNSTYEVAVPVTQGFNVNKLPNTITFNTLPNVSQSNGAISLGATASSSLSITYTSNTLSVCTVSGSTVTLLSSGFCAIQADQGGNGTYLVANPVVQDFSVFKITTLTIISGSVGSAYSQQINVAGNIGAGAWSATNLPTGFGINPSTGLLTGTPAVTLSQSIVITYTQGASTYSVTYLLTINVAGTPPSESKPKPLITPANGSGPINQPVTVTPIVTPVAPYNPGLCLVDPVSHGCKPIVTIKGQGTWVLNANGSITFTPVTGWAGTSTVILHAWDTDGFTDDKPISITITRAAGGARPPVSVTISGFAAGSPVLTTSIKNQIKAFLTKYNDYKNLQCTGVTMGPTVLKTDTALATNRAANACGFALSYLKGLTLLPNKTLTELFVGSNIRRVILTLSD